MPRKGVQYVGGDEPSFIQQFKQRVGHKEGPNIDSKRQIPTNDEDDDDDILEEKDDEKPVVVVIKKGDLTAEEAEVVEKEIEEGPARLDEKIVFRRPTKRSNAEQDAKDKSTESNTDSTGSSSNSKKKKDSSTKKSSDKKAKNSSLLSFADEEEDEV